MTVTSSLGYSSCCSFFFFASSVSFLFRLPPSIVSLSIIALLVLTELWSFLRVKTVHSLLVDTSSGSKLPVHFDLTFPALRCSDTSIDVMDVSGDVQVAAVKNIRRFRLDGAGRRIGNGEYEDHAHHKEGDEHTPVHQQPPGGGGVNPMLAALGIQFPGGNNNNNQPGQGDLHTDQKGEGCNIVGQLLVNKVAGNVHIALGGAHAHAPHADKNKEDKHEEEPGHNHGGAHTPSTHGGGGGGGGGHDHGHGHGHGHGGGGGAAQHIHQFMIHDLVNYNCSHVINHLSFGQQLAGVVHSPLQGTSQIIPEGAGTAHFQYFIKVVPTVYERAGYSSSEPLRTNQYSVTEQAQFISMQDAFGGNAQRIPGVFFMSVLHFFSLGASKQMHNRRGQLVALRMRAPCCEVAHLSVYLLFLLSVLAAVCVCPQL
jgi:hypothetical protein